MIADASVEIAVWTARVRVLIVLVAAMRAAELQVVKAMAEAIAAGTGD